MKLHTDNHSLALFFDGTCEAMLNVPNMWHKTHEKMLDDDLAWLLEANNARN
jgi:hypothetical protein